MCQWFIDNNVGALFPFFEENGFEELEYASRVTKKDMISMGINKLGHRIKLEALFEQYKANVSSGMWIHMYI